MKNVYVTRRARFNAAHKLWNDEWDEAKNLEVFGKCANPNWHGHNYELHVTVKGVPAEDTGYCMNLKDLKDIIKEHVEEPLDHRNLNIDVPFMKGKRTSTEILIIAIWEDPRGPSRSAAATSTTSVCTKRKTTTPTITGASELKSPGFCNCKIWSRER